MTSAIRSMTERKPDGGPAFPCTQMVEIVCMDPIDASGMTLRDWFAGQTLAGLSDPSLRVPRDAPEIARRAYALADAMLAEREK